MFEITSVKIRYVVIGVITLEDNIFFLSLFDIMVLDSIKNQYEVNYFNK